MLQQKFGRRRPPPGAKRLRLRDYLVGAAIPTSPASCDYSQLALTVLSDIMGNDVTNDCVFAAGYHIAGVETANAGDLFHATTAQVLADYSATSGYVPGDPSTDQGADEVTVLNYWTAHGFANGTKLIGWLDIDATNQAECQAAIYLFENCMLCFELADTWGAQANGFVWNIGVPPDPNKGHCVAGIGYDSTGIQVDSWGFTGTIMWPAVQQFCVPAAFGSLAVLLTPDQLARGSMVAPNGIAWPDLIADFQAMGGALTNPAYPPAPPTPALVNRWITSAFNNGPPELTREEAILTATGAVSSRWPPGAP